MRGRPSGPPRGNRNQPGMAGRPAGAGRRPPSRRPVRFIFPVSCFFMFFVFVNLLFTFR